MITLTETLRAELIEALSVVHRQVQAIRGLFRFEVGGRTFELPVEAWAWAEVPGVEGVEMCPLPPDSWPPDALPHTDYFAVRGPQGARSPERIRLPMAVRVEVLGGAVLYWKESAPGYVEYGAGDVFHVLPGEAYAFVAKEDFFNRVGFTPRITQP